MSGADKTTSPLRELLRHRGFWRWAAATQLLRLPGLMAPMAYVLASVQIGGSATTGGLMIAVDLITSMVMAPVGGRLVDRLGLLKWAPRIQVMVGVGYVGLAAAMVAKVPTAGLLVIIFVVSAVNASTAGVMRTLLSYSVPDRLRKQALALDSTLIEAVVIAGPVLVALASLLAPAAALLLMAIIILLAAVLVRSIAVPALADQVTRDLGGPGAVSGLRYRMWTNPRLLYWILVSIAFGQLLGTPEVGALPIALDEGTGAGVAAGLVTTLALSSMVAGAAYAWLASRIRASAVAQTTVLLTIMVAALVAVAFLDGWVWVFAGFVVIGLCTAPINSVRSDAAEYEMPKDRLAEGFGLIGAGNELGYAAAGLFLALPLQGFLLTGIIAAVLAIVLAPVLMRGQPLRQRGEDELPLVDEAKTA